MKSISLSVISFLIYLSVLIAINKIKYLKSARTASTPILLSIMVVPIYLLLYFSTSDSLGIFSPLFLRKHLLIDIFNGLILYTCLCIGFVDFLIGAAITPFSTDILLEIYQSGNRGLSDLDLKARYCSDSPEKGLVSKRIKFLNKIGFISGSSGKYLVAKNAMVWASITQGLRKFIS